MSHIWRQARFQGAGGLREIGELSSANGGTEKTGNCVQEQNFQIYDFRGGSVTSPRNRLPQTSAKTDGESDQARMRLGCWTSN